MASWSTGEQHTVDAVLARRLETDPDGPFLDVVGTMLTAADVDAGAGRVAATLRDLGVHKGDRVASLLENSATGVLTLFACARLGAISVPINTAYKGEFLQHQLADAGAGVLVVQHDLADRVATIADGLGELTGVLIEHPDDVSVPTMSGVSVHSWADALAHSHAVGRGDGVDPWDLATFIYTAGTTGPSKGCMLSHNYVVSLAEQIGRAWGRRPDDVMWTPLPLFHLNAIACAVVGSLLVGGRAAISRKFSVSQFWDEIDRTGATIGSLLGTLTALIAHDEREHPAAVDTTLRLVAAAPMPLDIAAAFKTRWNVDTFSGGYGVTEASLISALPAGVENKPNAAGVINDVEFDVRIFDDHDNELPRHEVGEIVCRPRRPHVMFEGYWGRPEATLEVSRNWWFHTGDFGKVDTDGFLYFVDRKKDYLRRRGENISSFEMEKIFLGHEAIVDVAVHAVPSPIGEDDLKVTAVLQPEAVLDEETLCRWAAERVPYFAIPRYVEFRDALPRNPVGRVLKFQLRDEGATAATWDAEAAGVVFEKR